MEPLGAELDNINRYIQEREQREQAQSEVSQDHAQGQTQETLVQRAQRRAREDDEFENQLNSRRLNVKEKDRLRNERRRVRNKEDVDFWVAYVQSDAPAEDTNAQSTVSSAVPDVVKHNLDLSNSNVSTNHQFKTNLPTLKNLSDLYNHEALIEGLHSSD